MDEREIEKVKKSFLSLGGIGLVPISPGTVGSVVSIPIFIGLYQILWFFDPLIRLVVYLGIIFLLIKKSIEFVSKNVPAPHDKQWIVVDELVGMLITYGPLLMVGWDWKWLIVGFGLFRFFDIVKPFFIKTIDESGTPASVIWDDAAAGGCAMISLIICQRLF